MGRSLNDPYMGEYCLLNSYHIASAIELFGSLALCDIGIDFLFLEEGGFWDIECYCDRLVFLVVGILGKGGYCCVAIES